MTTIDTKVHPIITSLVSFPNKTLALLPPQTVHLSSCYHGYESIHHFPHCNQYVAPLFPTLTSPDLAFDPNPTQSGSSFIFSVGKHEILLWFRKARGTESVGNLIPGMRATDACWVFKKHDIIYARGLYRSCVCQFNPASQPRQWSLTGGLQLRAALHFSTPQEVGSSAHV